MELPETTTLNFFNKILVSLLELTSGNASCSRVSLITHCKSIVLGGQLADYDQILDYCKYCGLIQVKQEMIAISALGQKFLDANREHYFEINEAQKQLIVERIVFHGPWSNHAREIFHFFSLNQNKSIYELSVVDASLTKSQNTIVHFFKYLGILQESNFVIQVDRKYSELVFQLTADSKALTEQQLEKILMENRKLGAQAENVVVEFEKRRLRKMGKFAQAELVKRISTINVSAGYDIESFDGDTDDIFPNRLIEVKATQGSQIRFYWSNNEMNVAKSKKESYWIYLLKEFKENDENLAPIMIQNPALNISNIECLTLEAHTFLIKEISEVTFLDQGFEDLRWYTLGQADV